MVRYAILYLLQAVISAASICPKGWAYSVEFEKCFRADGGHVAFLSSLVKVAGERQTRDASAQLAEPWCIHGTPTEKEGYDSCYCHPGWYSPSNLTADPLQGYKIYCNAYNTTAHELFFGEPYTPYESSSEVETSTNGDQYSNDDYSVVEGESEDELAFGLTQQGLSVILVVQAVLCCCCSCFGLKRYENRAIRLAQEK